MLDLFSLLISVLGQILVASFIFWELFKGKL
jgi:hypothetical protein